MKGCITFDKEAQDNLPQHIKDKMKADREKARREKNLKRDGLNSPSNYKSFSMKKMRAKFHCNSIESDGIAKLSAVYGTDDKDNEENNQFAEATPYGNLEIMVDNPNAKDFLQVGKSYYLDFSEAPN